MHARSLLDSAALLEAQIARMHVRFSKSAELHMLGAADELACLQRVQMHVRARTRTAHINAMHAMHAREELYCVNCTQLGSMYWQSRRVGMNELAVVAAWLGDECAVHVAETTPAIVGRLELCIVHAAHEVQLCPIASHVWAPTTYLTNEPLVVRFELRDTLGFLVTDVSPGEITQTGQTKSDLTFTDSVACDDGVCTMVLRLVWQQGLRSTSSDVDVRIIVRGTRMFNLKFALHVDAEPELAHSFRRSMLGDAYQGSWCVSRCGLWMAFTFRLSSLVEVYSLQGNVPQLENTFVGMASVCMEPGIFICDDDSMLVFTPGHSCRRFSRSGVEISGDYELMHPYCRFIGRLSANICLLCSTQWQMYAFCTRTCRILYRFDVGNSDEPVLVSGECQHSTAAILTEYNNDGDITLHAVPFSADGNLGEKSILCVISRSLFSTSGAIWNEKYVDVYALFFNGSATDLKVGLRVFNLQTGKLMALFHMDFQFEPVTTDAWSFAANGPLLYVLYSSTTEAGSRVQMRVYRDPTM